MAWTSIRDAHEFWQRTRRLPEPPADLEYAEAFILSGRPNTTQDAACILDVIYAYGGDPRCDGLDREALLRVQTFLAAA